MSRAILYGVSHPYRGVFNLSLSADFKTITKQKLYSEKEGLPELLHNYIFHIRHEVLVSTPKGVYVYDGKKDCFVPSETYTLLKDIPIQYMTEDPEGNVWFATNKHLGMLDFSKPTDKQEFTLQYFPELNGEILGGFESVYFHDAANVFVAGQKGGILLNYKNIRNRLQSLNYCCGRYVALIGIKRSGLSMEAILNL